MTVKILAIGDLHLGKSIPFLPNLLKIKIDNFRKLMCIAQSTKRIVILPGDVFDNAYPTQEEILSFLQVLKEFPDVQVIVITGNHDYESTELVSFLIIEYVVNILKAYPNVSVYSTPKYIKLGNIPTYVCPWPYMPNRKKKAHFCIGHHEWKGAKGDNGRILKDGASTSDIGNDYWLLGHLHRYQEADNYTYVGSPLQENFGENEDKGYVTFDLSYKNGVLDVVRNRVLYETPYTLKNIYVNEPKNLEGIPKKTGTYYKLHIKKNMKFDKKLLSRDDIVNHNFISTDNNNETLDVTHKKIHFDPIQELKNYLVEESGLKTKSKKFKKAVKLLNDAKGEI